MKTAHVAIPELFGHLHDLGGYRVPVFVLGGFTLLSVLMVVLGRRSRSSRCRV